MELFRKLDAKEEKEFRQWARDNWTPEVKVSSVWHYIVRDEIQIMKSEIHEQNIQNKMQVLH